VKIFFILLLIGCLFSCHKKIIMERNTFFPKQVDIAHEMPSKENVWIFILAGQSNMAGRAMVEPQDTVANKRILTVNKEGKLIVAKEPLHFYEPNLTGLDCGLSFAKRLLKNIPGNISIVLIPTAVGGSSISQWLGDSVFRSVQLFSNFTTQVNNAKQFGTIKAILWHQGESDANEKNSAKYEERLGVLINKFRSVTADNNLPILIGELGSFSKSKEQFSLINNAIHHYASQNENTSVISTSDLEHKGDSLHFNSKAQRTMGKRFAETYLSKYPVQ
jgi:Carbohydrate esterase, sialic acid-specific acetylesterase